jgi:hypothetical protein
MANYSLNNAGMNAISGISAQSIQTINLNSLANISSDGLLAQINPHVKKYQVIEIEEDLLALSTTWKRLRDQCKNGGPHPNISKLVDRELFSKVTEQDREQANMIRDYYSKKIVMWKLKDQQLTKFREDMNSFIHSNGKVFKEDMYPLVYRLPEFYEYDTQFESISNEHSKLITDNPKGKIEKKLKLQKTFNVDSSRTGKRKEYWFSDENDNLVLMSFRTDNSLLSLLDRCVENILPVKAFYSKRTRDNVDYYTVDKYTF